MNNEHLSNWSCLVSLQEDNLLDVLQLLLALVFEDTTHTISKMLLDHHGIRYGYAHTDNIKWTCIQIGYDKLYNKNIPLIYRVAARLLACSKETLRINGIKLIGKILHDSNTRCGQVTYNTCSQTRYQCSWGTGTSPYSWANTLGIVFYTEINKLCLTKDY